MPARKGGGARAPFVGRSPELADLERVLDAVAAGSPRVFRLSGPAGIGKTALVRRFLADRSDVHVLWAGAAEAESLLTFGVLHQIHLASGVDCDAGDGICTRTTGVVDIFGAGEVLIDLLNSAAPADPVVLVVDDVQWADSSSLQTLVFVVRRLLADKVMMVLIARDETVLVDPESLGRLPEAFDAGHVRLEGLDVDDVAALAESLHRPELPRASAQRLWTHTQGNPLHAKVLLEELTPDQLSGIDAGPLPAPRDISAVVLERLSAGPAAARTLVEGVSVFGIRCRIAAVASLIGAVDISDALDAAIDADLLRLSSAGRSIEFTHPLIQAAVYHQLTPGRRAELHRGIAPLVSEAESYRHLAAGTLGHDAGLGKEMAAFASREAERGAWASAAATFLAASNLFGSESDRNGLLLRSCECLVLGGEWAAAAAMRPEVERCPPGMHRELVLGTLTMVTGDVAGGRVLLEQGWEASTPPVDERVAAEVASRLGMVALFDGRGSSAVEWAEQSLALKTSEFERGLAWTVRALGMSHVGSIAEGLGLIEGFRFPRSAGGFGPEALGALTGRGCLLMTDDRLPEAVADLGFAHEVVRSSGPLFLRLVILIYLADAEYRLGHWDEAATHAELAVSLGEDSHEVWQMALAHSMVVLVASGRGEFDRAREHLEVAEFVASVFGEVGNRLCVSTAAGRLAQALGDYDAGIAAGESIVALGRADCLEQPGVQPWELLYAEALVRAGRCDDAVGVLDAAMGRSESRGHRSTQVGLWRVRALVGAAEGQPEVAEAAFSQAQLLVGTGPTSLLEQGLVALDHGSWLRRVGRRRRATDQLEASAAIFGRLGAVPFLDRAERELAALGLSPSRRTDEFRSSLTPQELAVATLVASGKTNREVAGELVVSVKTVEYHLSNIYSKLNIRSRTMLAARMFEAGGWGEPDGERPGGSVTP
jgi:DNA-binding CsgD family transcriptional regulator